MNRSEEDYIREIYSLHSVTIQNTVDSRVLEYVSVNLLAQKLHNTNQTTNEMIKKLVKKGLVIYKPYKGIKLTQEGINTAIKLIRIHRLWEYFLVTKLGYRWEEVDTEAHKLEHATSDMLDEKLYEYLGKPRFCPHGNPIPNLEGKLPNKELYKLSSCEIGNIYTFQRVKDDSILLEYLNNKHISLKAKLEVIDIDEISNNISVKVNDKIVIIGINIADKMFVSK